jgi:hypothetical protein
MNDANNIIGDGVVFFEFTDFIRNRMPKGYDGEDIFNMKHTELRSECGVVE